MDAQTFDQLPNPRRRDGIAYLTNGGQDDHLACFSDYGRTTAQCAPVAWRLAYLLARESGEPITSDVLDHTMTMVVNEHEDVAYIVRTYGGGHYR